MKLTITHHEILNCGFATENGTTLFASETPWSLTHHVTVIKRFHPQTDHSEVIAEITWHHLTSTQIKFKNGNVLDKEEFLQSHAFSSCVITKSISCILKAKRYLIGTNQSWQVMVELMFGRPHLAQR
jgi:hypothetical protein